MTAETTTKEEILVSNLLAAIDNIPEISFFVMNDRYKEFLPQLIYSQRGILDELFDPEKQSRTLKFFKKETYMYFLNYYLDAILDKKLTDEQMIEAYIYCLYMLSSSYLLTHSIVKKLVSISFHSDLSEPINKQFFEIMRNRLTYQDDKVILRDEDDKHRKRYQVWFTFLGGGDKDKGREKFFNYYNQ